MVFFSHRRWPVCGYGNLSVVGWRRRCNAVPCKARSDGGRQSRGPRTVVAHRRPAVCLRVCPTGVREFHLGHGTAGRAPAHASRPRTRRIACVSRVQHGRWWGRGTTSPPPPPRMRHMQRRVCVLAARRIRKWHVCACAYRHCSAVHARVQPAYVTSGRRLVVLIIYCFRCISGVCVCVLRGLASAALRNVIIAASVCVYV